MLDTHTPQGHSQRSRVSSCRGGKRGQQTLSPLPHAEGKRSAMKKSLAAATAFALAVAGVALFAPGAVAATRTVCPPGGASDTTFNGGLLVTGNNYCLLDHVTVNGGVTVDGGSDVDLENSTVNDGVNVTPGGEIEVDLGSIFGGTPTFSTVNGGIVLNNPFDWDIETAHISGGVTVNTATSEFPTFCGNTVIGNVSMRNVSVDVTYFGDPVDEFFECGGNTISGSLSISNSSFLEVEANTVNGSVSLSSSTLEFNGNTIGGSLSCSNGTVIVPGEPGDASGNTVGGANTC